MKYVIAALAVTGLFLSINAIAADSTADPVVVIATRTAQTADETLAAMSILRRAQIEIVRGPRFTLYGSGAIGGAEQCE